MFLNGERVCRANTTIPGCPTGSGGGTGQLSAGANITLSPNPWDPDTGVNATIAASGGGGGVTGAGSTNYVTKWTNNANPGALSTTSSIYDNGNVGIGTAGPTQKLEVAGNVKITGAGIYNAAGSQLVETNATDWT